MLNDIICNWNSKYKAKNKQWYVDGVDPDLLEEEERARKEKEARQAGLMSEALEALEASSSSEEEDQCIYVDEPLLIVYRTF